MSTRTVSIKMDTPQPERCRRETLAGHNSPAWLLFPEQLVSRRGWALSSSSNQRRPASSKTFTPRGGKQRSATESDYDRWLDRRLHQLYDPVLNEKIPDELASLLLQFDEKPQGDDDQN